MNAMRPQTLSTPRALQLWASALLVAFFLPGSAAAQSELRGNVQNPTFSPSDRALVAYSRQVEDTQELYLYDAAEGTVRQITAVEGAEERGGTDGFFEAGPDPSLRRFEGQLAWRPVLDSDGRQWFAFVSSASETGYGLFLSYLTPEGELADRIVEMPFQGQAGFPEWSPNGRRLVFSGSLEDAEGNELYLYPDVARFFRGEGGPLREEQGARGAPIPLTDNPAGNLYPAWSPNGQYIAYQSKQPDEGGRPNWGVSLLDLSTWAGPSANARPRSVRLSRQFSAYHEYKPSWSPNGSYVGFYVSQSRVDESADNRRQDIGVLRLVRGNRGRVQTGRTLDGYTGRRLAKNVLPNAHQGPGWHPAVSTASLIYVEKEENRGNPIYLADVARWSSDNANYSRRLSTQFEGETRLHEAVDATRGAEGLRLAFASQEGERLRLQLRNGLEPTFGASGMPQVSQEVGRVSALWRSAVFPGWGQLHKGERKWALIFAGVGAVALGATAGTIANHQSKVDDYDSFVEEKINPEALATLSESEVEQRFDKLQSLNDDVESAATVRTVAFVALAGVWAWNLYDTYRGFPTSVDRPVYANESLQVEAPRIGLAPTGDGMSAQFSLRIRF